MASKTWTRDRGAAGVPPRRARPAGGTTGRGDSRVTGGRGTGTARWWPDRRSWVHAGRSFCMRVKDGETFGEPARAIRVLSPTGPVTRRGAGWTRPGANRIWGPHLGEAAVKWTVRGRRRGVPAPPESVASRHGDGLASPRGPASRFLSAVPTPASRAVPDAALPADPRRSCWRPSLPPRARGRDRQRRDAVAGARRGDPAGRRRGRGAGWRRWHHGPDPRRRARRGPRGRADGRGEALESLAHGMWLMRRPPPSAPSTATSFASAPRSRPRRRAMTSPG